MITARVFLSLTLLVLLFSLSTAEMLEKRLPPHRTAAGPIARPTQSEVLLTGAVYSIQWQAKGGSKARIELWDSLEGGSKGAKSFGTSCDDRSKDDHCATIAKSASNSGKYDWVVPSPPGFFAGDFKDPPYFIWITVFGDDKAEIDDDKNTYFVSGNFSFAEVFQPNPSLLLPPVSTSVPGASKTSRANTATATSPSASSGTPAPTQTGTRSSGQSGSATTAPSESSGASSTTSSAASQSTNAGASWGYNKVTLGSLVVGQLIGVVLGAA